MALRFESLLIGALVLGCCLAGLTARGDGHDDNSPVPMSCTGAGCRAIGFKQGGKADLVTIEAPNTSNLKPIAQSLVIQCMIRPDDSNLDVPCGQVTLGLRDADTTKRTWLEFNGSVFTIPVHKDFGRYDLHIQPKRCAIAKDIHNALVGSVTTLTFRHCSSPSKTRNKK